MAKRDKTQDGLQDGKKSHVVLNIIIALTFILFWLAIFAVFIKLDIGNIGSMLRPVLRDIPVVNKVLPDLTQEEIAEENDYPYTTMEEALARIKELEAMLSDEDDQIADSSETIASLEAEIERLQVFEDNQVAFEERVAAFDENVVFAEEAPDLEEYKAYYEEIAPDNAAEIYEKVIKQLEIDEAIQEKADIYQAMKPASAASILEEMTADTEFVAQVLLCMKPKYSSLILAEMDPTFAAKITKKMLDLDAQALSELQ